MHSRWLQVKYVYVCTLGYALCCIGRSSGIKHGGFLFFSERCVVIVPEELNNFSILNNGSGCEFLAFSNLPGACKIAIVDEGVILLEQLYRT